MSGQRLVIAFYVPAIAGVTVDHVLVRLRIGHDGGFGPLPFVELHTETTEEHHVILVFFLASAFFAMREHHRPGGDLPLDQDAALPLATAVREAAVRAGAEVAMVITHPEQANPEWLRARYWMVMARDVTALTTEHVGFLYLDDELVGEWQPPWPAGSRDELPGGPGRSIFAGRGWSRWA